jgi:hypothetical protein
MTVYMYDAAFQPDLAKVKANGGVAISRYFVGPNPTWAWKRVTPAQVIAAHTAGLGMVCNYEGTADPALTHANGQQSARDWLIDIHRCAVPAGRGIAGYFSIDVYTDPSRYPAAADYFAGINDIIVPAGYVPKVYSQGGLIDYLCSHHRVRGKQWLAAPTSWPGYNPASPNVSMVQLVGTPVPGTDQNKILTVGEVDAYWPDGSPYAPEVDLPLSDADLTRIAQIVHDQVLTVAVRSTEGKKMIHDQVALAIREQFAPDGEAYGRLFGMVQGLVAKYAVDQEALAAAIAQAVVAALPADTGGGFTAEQVQAAAEAAIGDVLGSVDNPPTP